MKRPTVSLERQHVVSASVPNRLRKLRSAEIRVRSDRRASQIERPQQLDRCWQFRASPIGCGLREQEPLFGGPHMQEMEGALLTRARERSAKCLAVEVPAHAMRWASVRVLRWASSCEQCVMPIAA